MLEVIRSVSDWLDDATNGVNALISAVPRDVGDAEPTALAAVLDETRSAILALKRVPEQQATPFLFVWQLEDAIVEPENQGKQDIAGFTVAVAYVDRDSNAATAVQDGWYVMRAVRRSLNNLHLNASVADRTRNNIIVRNHTSMRLVRPTLMWEDAVMSVALAVTYPVRDEAP